MKNQTMMILGACINFLAVGLGAFASHALQNTLEAKGAQLWNLATHFLWMHGLTFLFLGSIGLTHKAYPPSQKVGWFFLLGVFLFCSSLYTVALTKNRHWAYGAPIGGISLLIGWIMLAWSFYSNPFFKNHEIN